MPTVNQAIDDLLAQKRMAVAGVSGQTGGPHSGNAVYLRLDRPEHDAKYLDDDPPPEQRTSKAQIDRP